MRASTAAGSSVASWNRAVERDGLAWMPRRRRRSASQSAVMGRPGCPPGNSQGEVPWSPRVAWPRRVATSCRTRASIGAGRMTGSRLSRRRTWVSLVWTWSRVSWLIVAVQAGDAVFGLDGVVVQQSAGVLPAGLGVDDAGWAVPPDGGELQRGRLVLVGPPDEVPHVGAGVSAGQPCLEVALPSGGEGEVVGVEPVKQGDGGVDVGSGGDDLTVGGVGAVEPATQPAEHMPHGVAVQHLPLVGVVAFGDHPCDPAFEAGQVFVARRQRCGGDQDTAQVMQELSVGQFIKGRVSQCPLTCRELTQDHRNGSACSARPARRRVARDRRGGRAGPAASGGSWPCRRPAAVVVVAGGRSGCSGKRGSCGAHRIQDRCARTTGRGGCRWRTAAR
jgi:hypothetical protein